MFKVNNRNTRTRCEICSLLTIKTPERQQYRPSGVFIVNFEHISCLVLVSLLLFPILLLIGAIIFSHISEKYIYTNRTQPRRMSEVVQPM